MPNIQQLVKIDGQLEQKRDLVFLREEVERLKLILDIAEYTGELRRKMETISSKSNLVRLGNLLEKWETVQKRMEEGASGGSIMSYSRISTIKSQTLMPAPVVMDRWVGQIRSRLDNLVSKERSRIHF